MRARKKRRTNVTWFPTIGTGRDDLTKENFLNGREFVNIDVSTSTGCEILPLVPDVPLEADDIDVEGGGQLVQAIGQEYILQRIVGKVLFAVTGQFNLNNDPSNAHAALVACGFFVARSEDKTNGGPDFPIGGATSGSRVLNYNPLHPDCIREPWIWRRTWILGNSGFPANAADQDIDIPAFSLFPPTTAGYGSVSDGPHIDTKIKRRVGNDDRLWFAVAHQALPLETATDLNLQLSGYIDFRVLGALRRAHNRSAF